MENSFKKYLRMTVLGHMMRKETVSCCFIVVNENTFQVYAEKVLLLSCSDVEGRNECRKYVFM